MFSSWNPNALPSTFDSPHGIQVSLSPQSSELQDLQPLYTQTVSAQFLLRAPHSVKPTRWREFCVSPCVPACRWLCTQRALSNLSPPRSFDCYNDDNDNDNDNDIETLNNEFKLHNPVPRRLNPYSPTTTQAAPSPPQSIRLTYAASGFVSMTRTEKELVVKTLVQRKSFDINKLRKLATLHDDIFARHSDGTQKNTGELRAEFSSHHCTDICLIRNEDIVIAGMSDFPALSETDFTSSANALKLRNRVSGTSNSRKRKNNTEGASSRKKRKTTSSTVADTLVTVEDQSASTDHEDEWPEMLPLTEKLNILQESFDAGNNAAIKKVEWFGEP
ncbi:hypothetical protein K435DRAFT_865124 [Dendrothele bispora CBS 962.96]|uniref:Uncharacterized protein n=1 Tax=Dendrothele bispora (strain CBS 962.96) TaxID=1314807 RepID=A0A4S8LKP1_DENBC|nr:hypothetical protein K435DRAFT_865124 [Dendrothele bispora CBS 962.96]